MKASKQVYVPKFPQAHALLLNVYEGLMTAKPKQVPVWATRFQALVNGWIALQEDGALPPLFTKHFWEDVRDVAGRVHGKIELSKLTEQQSTLTFGIVKLQNMFGGM